MTNNTTLTLEIALGWDGNTSLTQYTSIDDQAAEVLAKYEDADLELRGLISLSLPAAQALSKQESGSLNLRGLASLKNDVAEAFSHYGGFLGLEGLTSLSLPAAQALSKSVQFLDLSGLTSVLDPVAEVLAKCKCRIHLRGLRELTHPGLAAKLAEADDELDLPGLTELSDPVAVALSKTKPRLLLEALKRIDNFELAWKLFVQDKDSYPLSFISSLSDADATTIANYKGNVYLDGLDALSAAAAEILSRHVGVLGLRGMKSLTDNAAESLSHHNHDTVILPQQLSAKVAALFLYRFTGRPLGARKPPAPDGTIDAIDLQHGKLYECIIESYGAGKKTCDFVQLAIDPTTNRRFVLFGAKRAYEEDPEWVRQLIKTDFHLLWLEEWSRPKGPIPNSDFLLDQDGIVLHDEAEECWLHGFRETDVI